MIPTITRGLALFTLLATGCRSVSADVDSSAPSDVSAPPSEPVVADDPAEPKPAEPPVRTAAPTRIEEFDGFLGLHRGDTLDAVRQKFGEAPYKELGDSSGLDTYYYGLVEDTDPDDGAPNSGDDFLFVITIVAATGWVFNIECMAGDYAAFGIVDPDLELLGKPLQEITARFGPPASESSGFNKYEYVSADETIEYDVEFVCYEHDDYLCNELWVTWYEPEL